MADAEKSGGTELTCRRLLADLLPRISSGAVALVMQDSQVIQVNVATSAPKGEEARDEAEFTG